jgi:osmotically-inducible protein OsmY
MVMTDFELKREVESELNWDPEVKSAAAIGVSVKDGIVTLRGHVDSFIEKLSAENAVTRVRGAKAVVNELEVRIPKSSERTDEDLARAAVDTLAWMTEVPRDQVKVKVENGIITLMGNVNWNYQRQSAENAVRGLMGVKGVINLIEVRLSADKALVKAKIEEALKRNAELDAKRITVETVGSKVILRGTVRSWAERKEAERVAWEAPGVTEVDNQITVAVAA